MYFISQAKKYFNSFIYIFFIISILFIVSPYAFSATSFTATVDKTSISMDEQIMLTLNLSDGKVSNIDLYSMKDFDVQFRTNSSNIEIVNGDFSSSESFIYALTPKKAGNLIIEPVTVNIKGKDYSTQAINITVGQAQQQNNVSSTSPVFITAELDNYKPYLNQQIVYTFRYYRKIQTNNTSVEYPEFKDFWVENLGKEESFETVINGQKYAVNQIKKAIFPTRTGKIEIPATKVVTELVYNQSSDDFFGVFQNQSTETKRLSTNPLTVNVRPLPTQNISSKYNNIIGKNLKITSSISQSSANVGDSVTLKINLKGNGNIGDISNIDLPLNPNVKVYKNKPSQKKYTENNELITEKDFEIAIVPLKSGNIKIPSISIPYFDTGKNAYKYLNSNAFELKVSGKDEENIQSIQNLDAQKDVEILGQDIFSIYQDLDALKDKSLNPLKVIAYILWFLIPISLYLAIIFIKSNKFKLLKNKNIEKEHSYTSTLKKINEIENSVGDFGEISVLFQNYVFNRLKIMPKDLLNNRNLEFSEDLKILLDKFEFLKFSGSNISLNDKKDIINLTKKVLDYVESLKK